MQYEVTINRAKWRSGGQWFVKPTHHAGRTRGAQPVGKGDTFLRNDDGFKCCLGFAAQQIGGLRARALTQRGMPGDLAVKIPKLNKGGGGYGGHQNTKFSSRAARINDDPKLTTAEREAALIELFRANSIKLTFTGKYRAADVKRWKK